MKLSPTGLGAINAALSIVKGDRLWLKFGHGRFVQLRRDGDNWVLHHTKLEISKDEAREKGYSEDARSRSRSISFEGRTDGLAHLLSISRNEDGGVFWVPAGVDADLPLKEAITQSDHLGCEIDNASHTEQLQRYEWFSQVSGLEYGLQLSSGSKSFHSHVFLNEPAPIDVVVRLRRLFVLCLMGDPAVTRPHQPMRFPGFFRREKGNFQELLSVSDSRYSLAEVEQGLTAVFADLGWAFPATLSNELWANLQRALKANDREAIAKLLQRGDSFYTEQAKEQAERQHKYAQKQLSGQASLIDAIAEVERQLSPAEAFNNPAHDRKFSSSNHGRGVCQWHPSTSNSAWLSQVNGTWVFHCPKCTNDKPVSPLQYWIHDRRGGVGQMPTGGDWAALAKEWLKLHGVALPERPVQPVEADQCISALLPKTERTQPAAPRQSKAEWLKEQKIERDRQSYAKITKLLGIETVINTDEPDYKNQAREVFYQPLKQHLKYETRSELISGFASEIKPASEERSLIAYDCSQGTGKSNNALIPPALRTAKDGGRVLIFVPTRGLAKEFKGRINERAGEDIAATHLDPNYHSAAIVVSCPGSAYKFKGQNFDLIQIDECNEVLHRIESAELGNAGPQSLAAFRKLLADAKEVAIATAAMSGWTLAAVQTIGGFMPDEIREEQINRLPTAREEPQ